MEQTHIYSAQRTVLKATGKKLHALIRELMTHSRAVVLLSGGLRLTWDQDGDVAKFGLTRSAPSAPGAVEIETVIKQARPALVLGTDQKAWTEVVTRSGESAKWIGIYWSVTIERMPLSI